MSAASFNGCRRDHVVRLAPWGVESAGNVPEGTHRRFVKVFLKEHLWKSGKKRQHGNRIRMMDLGTIAEIPVASVVKKPRQKWSLEV